jgi:phosphoribosylcarboxyaminoimidazole (NCAIR) mutase
MPGGIPVATVALNGALNAGILAVKFWEQEMKRLQKTFRNIRIL